MSLDIYEDAQDPETIWVDSRYMRSSPDYVDKVSASGDELTRALKITGLPQWEA